MGRRKRKRVLDKGDGLRFKAASDKNVQNNHRKHEIEKTPGEVLILAGL